MSLSAHKVNGPKGIGVLFVRSRGPCVRLQPVLYGGGHEQGLRSGTLGVPNIVGFGKACELAGAYRESEPARLLRLRERLSAQIRAGLRDVTVNGHATFHLPGLLHLSFAGIDGESLMHTLREVAVSQGSSCTAGSLDASHVLRAIGLSEQWVRGSIRFGIGRFTTEEEIDWVSERVVQTVRHLRARPHVTRGRGGAGFIFAWAQAPERVGTCWPQAGTRRRLPPVGCRTSASVPKLITQRVNAASQGAAIVNSTPYTTALTRWLACYWRSPASCATSFAKRTRTRVGLWGAVRRLSLRRIAAHRRRCSSHSGAAATYRSWRSETGSRPREPRLHEQALPLEVGRQEKQVHDLRDAGAREPGVPREVEALLVDEQRVRIEEERLPVRGHVPVRDA